MSKSSIFKAVGIMILAIGIILAFSGCGGDSGSLVGKWTNESEGETIEFRSDGTATVSMGTTGDLDLTYEIDGENVVMGAEGYEQTMGYSVDGDTLKLTYEGESMDYKRVE